MLLSSSNRKYLLTHYHIFLGCVPEMFVTSYSVNYCIYIPGKPGFLFSLSLCSLRWVQIFGYVLACRSCSFVCTLHNTISLPLLCKLILGHWTYKMPVGYILSSVWVRLSIFSQLSIIIFSLPISLVMIRREYTLCLIIIIKSEVWTNIYCLGFGHETMVCAVCLSIFL